MSFLFNPIPSTEKSDAVERLIGHSTPSAEFFLFVVLSTVAATLGILVGSVPVLIGSMLIAPMLYPILSLALGLSMPDSKIVGRSLSTLFRAVIWAISASAIVSAIFAITGKLPDSFDVIRTEVSFVDVVIAIVAGMAAAVALVRPHMNDSIIGVAVAAAIVPPLALAGIGLGTMDYALARIGLQMFAVSVVGIVLVSIMVFTLVNFNRNKSQAQKVIKKEDKQL